MLEFKRMRKSYLLLLRFIFLAALLAAPPVQAQTGYTATLSELQLDAFPQVSAYLDFHDGEGKFIQDLNANQVNILENERRLPVMQLNTLHPGAQFVIVITFGPAMGVRDGLGMSRYDYLLQ